MESSNEAWLNDSEESASPNKQPQTCSTCNEPVSDDALECMWCECLQHKNCIKISDNQEFVLSNLPSNVVYFCMPCFHKLPSTIKAHDNVQELYSFIEKKLELVETALVNKFTSFNDQITELLKTTYSKTFESQIVKITDQNQSAISDLTTKVDQVAKDVSANSTKLGSLKNQLENLEAPVATISIDDDTMQTDLAGPLASNSVSSITVGMVDEQREREKRKLNLIFHNVAESTKSDGTARKKQ